jgi:hypothetical protein
MPSGPALRVSLRRSVAENLHILVQRPFTFPQGQSRIRLVPFNLIPRPAMGVERLRREVRTRGEG